MSKFITALITLCLLIQLGACAVYLSTQAKFDNSSDYLLLLVITVCFINISKLQGDSSGKDSSKEQAVSES